MNYSYIIKELASNKEAFVNLLSGLAKEQYLWCESDNKLESSGSTLSFV